ncbi:MAG TPA: transketolase C-terminal domain-containing protein [Ignavibacteria bacterium]|nr:transketolase C-terminal domain-containing protein [Ignavibacteria bacterium]
MKYNIENPEMKETRQGFADAIVELGKTNEKIVVLGGDVTGSVKTNFFRDAYPDRFFSVGIAEQDMMGTAAGMALIGKIPIASTYGEFATGRPFDQIRQSIAYSEMNVKICASHCGISVGPDGATHQSLEDVGIMRILPHMTVCTPCDYNQTYKTMVACIDAVGPFYVRFYRDKTPNFTSMDDKFEIGKADLLVDGSDVTLIANGLLVWEAIVASEMLKKDGISARVVNMHTIKPIDVDMILKCAKETGYIVTCEDHQKQCGLFGAVAEVLAERMPTQMDYIAVEDTFGESGKIYELMNKYLIDRDAIVKKVKKRLKK